ncbi:Uncharacterised protein [Legionella pneumophila]|nr:Uncharacterised protein [Legionella pneumophila]CZI50722.1 Uncharacterised protein [Legionella pneumophila]CZP66694.1 Uncharacterised protein [Legionella pneumophila]CZP93604.1 Uncharacterised protein [Legionella pneumophila]CZP99923.1 Uncharacterised protein [Legionella pneumophila]
MGPVGYPAVTCPKPNKGSIIKASPPEPTASAPAAAEPRTSSITEGSIPLASASWTSCSLSSSTPYCNAGETPSNLTGFPKASASGNP